MKMKIGNITIGDVSAGSVISIGVGNTAVIDGEEVAQRGGKPSVVLIGEGLDVSVGKKRRKARGETP